MHLHERKVNGEQKIVGGRNTNLQYIHWQQISLISGGQYANAQNEDFECNAKSSASSSRFLHFNCDSPSWFCTDELHIFYYLHFEFHFIHQVKLLCISWCKRNGFSYDILSLSSWWWHYRWCCWCNRNFMKFKLILSTSNSFWPMIKPTNLDANDIRSSQLHSFGWFIIKDLASFWTFLTLEVEIL